jgi:hypothetical protein
MISISDIARDAPTEEEAMLNGIVTYYKTGNVYGDFLTALLTNNFVEAVTRADAHNSEFIHEWALWLYNSVPMDSWGSEEIVEDYTGLDSE